MMACTENSREHCGGSLLVADIRITLNGVCERRHAAVVRRPLILEIIKLANQLLAVSGRKARPKGDDKRDGSGRGLSLECARSVD